MSPRNFLQSQGSSLARLEVPPWPTKEVGKGITTHSCLLSPWRRGQSLGTLTFLLLLLSGAQTLSLATGMGY